MKETVIAETGNIKACYRAIGSFFDAFDLLHARKYILQSLLAANSNKLWKGKCPADLVFFYNELPGLLAAATAIAKCGCIRQEAVITKEEDTALPINDHKLYCRWWNEQDYALYLPKYLTVKEFFNPYKALKKAVHYISKEEFNGLLSCILQYALSYNSLKEAGFEWDTLQLNVMLQTLAEAAYLLDIRTNPGPANPLSVQPANGDTYEAAHAALKEDADAAAIKKSDH